jgi:hypothetical protein
VAAPAAGKPIGLVAFYRFEETTGAKAIDSSRNENHGTFQFPAWRSGRLGHALRFRRGETRVELPRLVTADFTIALWLKTRREGPEGEHWRAGLGLVCADADTTGQYGLTLLGDHVAFGAAEPDVTVRGRTRVTDNDWHHVAVTRLARTGQIKLYVDGRLEATALGPTVPMSAAPRITVGCRQTGGHAYRGSIDELQVYDRVLDPREIITVVKGRAITSSGR